MSELSEINFDECSTSFEDRLAVWGEAIKTQEEHVKVARGLWMSGAATLKTIRMSREGVVEIDSSNDLSKILQSATSAIRTGTDLERVARKELMKLQKRKPAQ